MSEKRKTYRIINDPNKIPLVKNDEKFCYDCTVRLFFLIVFNTLAKLAVFFLVLVFDAGTRTRCIVGAASSSIKSNSKSLLSL